MDAVSPTVFIVDDDTAVRTALARLVSSAGHSVRTFATAEQFLENRQSLGPGCLLLDVRLPTVDGLELQRQLREADIAIPIVFMTGFGDIETSVRAIKSGAMDYLVKPVAEETLLLAIEGALAEEARARAARMEKQVLATRCESLTPRETQVMRLVLAGRLNKQIARELGISEKTVKVHRGRVMEKMGVRRVAQLVQFANRLGLDTTPEGAGGASVTTSSWLRSGTMHLSGVSARSLADVEANGAPVSTRS